MIMTRKQWNKQWVNDHLDLYLYAASLGDASWQREIMDTLQQMDEAVEREILAHTADLFNNLLVTIAAKIIETLAFIEEAHPKERGCN